MANRPALLTITLDNNGLDGLGISTITALGGTTSKPLDLDRPISEQIAEEARNAITLLAYDIDTAVNALTLDGE